MPERSEAMSEGEFEELARSQMTLERGPLDSQVGGDHYKQMPIQPAEFIHKNGLNYLQGNIIKYICRHAAKGGVEDLRKAIHYTRLLMKFEYGADD
jgi:hypothetical protein